MEEKPVNKTNTNSYTFIFAIVMVIVVGVVLAFAATSLQPMQYEKCKAGENAEHSCYCR